MKVGIIGLGYWGPHYVRIINELADVDLAYCCDLDEKNLVKMKGRYLQGKFTVSHHDILHDPEVQAVIIATPPNSHYKLIKEALEAGKDVLVEKPLTLDTSLAKEVVDIANRNKRVLMVGHTYVFNPGIEKLREMIRQQQFGRMLYGTALRLGLSPIRKSASALWDLATHDISVFVHLFGKPLSVLCVGESYLQEGVEDYVNLILHYPNNVQFSAYASWLCPEKVRKMTFVGTKSMVVFDDVNKMETIKIFRKTIDLEAITTGSKFSDHQSMVREGDTEIPFIKQSEPLKNQMIHFLDCIRKRTIPQSDGLQGLEVVKVLEAAEQSLRSRGTSIEIK